MLQFVRVWTNAFLCKRIVNILIFSVSVLLFIGVEGKSSDVPIRDDQVAEVARQRSYPGGEVEEDLEVQKPLFQPKSALSAREIQKKALEELQLEELQLEDEELQREDEEAVNQDLQFNRGASRGPRRL